MFFLDELTSRTLSHPLSDICLHTDPTIELLKVLIHLGSTRMNRKSGLMSFSHNLFLQTSIIGNTDPTINKDGTILCSLVLRPIILSNLVQVLVLTLNQPNSGKQVGLVDRL